MTASLFSLPFSRLIVALVLVVIVGLTVQVPSALAVNELDLTPSSDKFFHINDAAPGDSFVKDLKVTNTSAEEADIFLNVDNTTNQSFAKNIHFYLRDKSSKKYLIGGTGDHYTLKEMNGAGDVFIERLNPGESNTYQIKVALDTSIGNEFQGAETKFDFVYNLSSESGAGPIPTRPGVPAGGVSGSDTDTTPDQGFVQGAQDENTLGSEAANGTVEGAVAAAVCSQLTTWKWALILLAFAALFGAKKLSRTLSNSVAGTIIQLVSLVGVLALWYFFDNCYRLWWVPITALVIALILSLIPNRDEK